MADDFPPGTSFTISCGDCAMKDTPTCDDCVVTFITGRDPEDAVVIDVEEARAVRLLAGAGLVPELRHVPRTGEHETTADRLSAGRVHLLGGPCWYFPAS